MLQVKDLISKFKWLPGVQPAANLAPQDLVIIESGVEFNGAKDKMDYLWFEVIEREDGRGSITVFESCACCTSNFCL